MMMNAIRMELENEKSLTEMAQLVMQQLGKSF